MPLLPGLPTLGTLPTLKEDLTAIGQGTALAATGTTLFGSDALQAKAKATASTFGVNRFIALILGGVLVAIGVFSFSQVRDTATKAAALAV